MKRQTIDIDLAIYSMVHDSDVSVKELAERTGIGYQIILNKANPSNDHNKFTVNEAIAIQKITGNHAVLEAMQTILDYEDENSCVQDSLMSASKEFADVVVKANEAMSDGRLSAREKRQLHREIDEANDALKQLKKAVSRTI